MIELEKSKNIPKNINFKEAYYEKSYGIYLICHNYGWGYTTACYGSRQSGLQLC